MAVRRPTLDQLRSVAEDLGMTMADEELKSYDALMQANFSPMMRSTPCRTTCRR